MTKKIKLTKEQFLEFCTLKEEIEDILLDKCLSMCKYQINPHDCHYISDWEVRDPDTIRVDMEISRRCGDTDLEIFYIKIEDILYQLKK